MQNNQQTSLEAFAAIQVRVRIAAEQWSVKWTDHALNEWFHLVAIWHRMAGLSMYINGCLVGNMTSPRTVKYSPNGAPPDLVLGRDNNARYGDITLAPLLSNRISVIHGSRINYETICCPQFCTYSYQILCHVGGTSPPT